MKEYLERIFCWKISRELDEFHGEILKKEKEEIYAMAYQIDSIINIYELLKEFCQKMDVERLQKCIYIPNLLAFLYMEWLKIPDSQNQELEHTLWSCIAQGMEEREEKVHEEIDSYKGTDAPAMA